MNAPHTPQIPLLELDLLKTLVAIAETGNFSAASEIVFRTPSAVSMQVKRIEELVGRPVFIRDSRSVSLTADGEALLEHGRRLLALNREMIAKFVVPDLAGDVRLGAVDHTAEKFLPSVLKRFSESHPGIAVDVTVENSRELAAGIKANELDLAIVSCDSNKYCDYQVESLMRERLVWAGLKNGVAVEQNPLPISVWEEGCIWRRMATDGLEKSNRDYRVTFKSAYISGQKAGLLADFAVAPLPLSACEGDITIIGREHNLPELSDYTIGFIRADEVSDPAAALIDHLRASFTDK